MRSEWLNVAGAAGCTGAAGCVCTSVGCDEAVQTPPPYSHAELHIGSEGDSRHGVLDQFHANHETFAPDVADHPKGSERFESLYEVGTDPSGVLWQLSVQDFADAGEAQRCGALRCGVEPAPGVRHHQPKPALGLLEVHDGLAGAAVPDDVLQCFLRDAVEAERVVEPRT